MKKLLMVALAATSFFSNFLNAQNVGIGTATPGTKLTIYTGLYGFEHTNGVVSIKSYVAGIALGKIGTFSNHPFQLMSNNGSGQFVLMPTGLVGIANGAPSLAGLTVDNAVGNVNAMFGSNTTGVAFESNWPGIGFNSYYSNGRKYMSAGFGGVIGYNPTNGTFTFASTTASGAANAVANTPATLTIDRQGYVGIGTTAPGSALDVSGNANISQALSVGGTFKLTAGTPANGTYLAGNVNGYGNWTPTSNLTHITTATNNYGFSHTDGIATIATYVGTPGVSNYGLGGWIGTNSNHPLFFYTNSATTPAMTISKSGNIGINAVPNTSRINITGDIAVGQNSTVNLYNTAISGYSLNSTNSNTGIHGSAVGGIYAFGLDGYADGASHNYGVYGTAAEATGFAGYFAGNVYSSGSYQPSDEKLKTDIGDYSDAVSALNKLHVKTYKFRQEGDYKKMNLSTEPQIGIIAAEIQQTFPHLVKKATSQIMDETTHKPSGRTVDFNAVNYTGLVPILVKGIQEQKKEIEGNKAEIESLKAAINELKAMIKK